MPQHVQVDLHTEASGLASTFEHRLEPANELPTFKVCEVEVESGVERPSEVCEDRFACMTRQRLP